MIAFMPRMWLMCRERLPDGPSNGNGAQALCLYRNLDVPESRANDLWFIVTTSYFCSPHRGNRRSRINYRKRMGKYTIRVREWTNNPQRCGSFERQRHEYSVLTRRPNIYCCRLKAHHRVHRRRMA